MILHIVKREGEVDQKSYLTAPIYSCKACEWEGTVIESCAHIAANQVEVIAPPKVKGTIN